MTLGAAEGATEAEPPVDVLALDEALNRITAFHPEKARLVELRYFAGLSIEETVGVLGISPAKNPLTPRNCKTFHLYLFENQP